MTEALMHPFQACTLDVECWMKSPAESGLGFDFFRLSSCFEIFLL